LNSVASSNRVTIQLGRRLVQVVPDSGASLSYVSEDFANRLTSGEALAVFHDCRQARGADGRLLKSMRVVTLAFSCGPVTSTHDFGVLRGLPCEALLGFDLLAVNGVVLDPRAGCLRFTDHPGAVLDFDVDKSNAILQCAESTLLPPRTETLVRAVLSKPPATEYLAQPIASVESAKGVCVASTLHQGRHPVLRLLNCTERPIQLRQGSSLARAVEANVLFTMGEESDFATSPDKVRTFSELAHNSQDDPLNDVSIGEQLPPHQADALRGMLARFRDVFASKARPIGLTSRCEHTIDTGGSAPLSQGLRPSAPKDRETERTEVDKMLEYGVIEPSTSPWASPIVMVSKKDGSTRFCVDYRRVNTVTKKDVHPLPRTSDLLEALGRAKFFSVLDAASGYWQIPVAESDREKTAFICSSGLYQFRTMPFGLCNAPATYQRFMNCLLAGLNWICCLVYLDDVIVFSTTFEEHLAHLEDILSRFRQADTLLKPTKCRFAVEEVEYLGHLVSSEGVRPDPKKVDKLRKYPSPTTVTEVRAFLGLAGYYRRFVRNFSLVAAPLFDLLKEKAAWRWTEVEESSMRKLIDAICHDAILPHPRFDLPFVVDSDASDVGLGAVLSQVVDGAERPIMFASRRIQPAESKWHIREKEALGLIFALETFRHFLLGSEFTVRTDHRSLEWLMNAKTGRLCRWALRLGEFGDFTVAYRPGEKHSNADAFTRTRAESECIPDHATFLLLATDPWLRTCPRRPTEEGRESEEESTPPPALSVERLRIAQKSDAAVTKARTQLARGKRPELEVRDGVLGVTATAQANFRPLLPESLFSEVVRSFHEPPEHAHLGSKRVASLVKARYSFPNLAQRVTEALKSCLRCARRKPPASRQGYLASQMPRQPWQVVSGDFCGPYVHSERGFVYILVLYDNFTKWVELIPCHDATARTVAQAFYERIICRHGTPAYFLSDRGGHFKANLIESLCATFGVRKIFSSAYYPQGDGYAERFMRTLNNSLATLASQDHSRWDQYVAGIAFAYNSTPHAGTGVSPFLLNHGREPQVRQDLWRPWEWSGLVPEESESYLRHLRRAVEEAKADALSSLQTYYDRYRERYDRSHSEMSLAAGDRVLVRLSDFERSKFECRKLAPRWSEPVRIVRVLTNNKACVVDRGNGHQESVNASRLLPIPCELWDEVRDPIPDDTPADAKGSKATPTPTFDEEDSEDERTRDDVPEATSPDDPSIPEAAPDEAGTLSTPEAPDLTSASPSPSPYVDISPSPSPSPVVDLPNEEWGSPSDLFERPDLRFPS